MKKMIMLSTAALAVTLMVQNISFAADTPSNKPEQKYAVVDVKKVVNSSKSVKDLKEERAKQKETVMNFVKDGNAKVDAEKDPVKKEELKKKLNNDLKYMTNTYDKRYQEGLQKINSDMSAEITKIGQEKKYDLILTTDAVLYGGKNITSDVVKAVK